MQFESGPKHRKYDRRPKRKMLVTPQEARALRKATGLSQQKAAAMFGNSRGTIQCWENGRLITPKWAILLYKILGAKRQALITGQRPTIDID